MSDQGSYSLNQFTTTIRKEIERLKFQVELFWKDEFRFYKRLGLSDGMSILECGSGPGFVMSKLLSAFPNITGTALEVDSFLIEAMKDNFSQSSISKCKIVRGSIMDIALADNSFDFVILSQTLHEIFNPEFVIQEMLRVGKKAIISFFNLAYCGYRFSFFFRGRFPKNFPYSWKNTYASLLTAKDFMHFCQRNSINIIKEVHLGENDKRIHFLPNYRSQVVFFVLRKKIVLDKPESPP